MRSALEYEQRAEACRTRAQTLSDARDRAQWLKLADDWMTVSRMQFHTLSAEEEVRPRSAEKQTRLWRGELGTGSEKQRRELSGDLQELARRFSSYKELGRAVD